jgi:hypothetical protein
MLRLEVNGSWWVRSSTSVFEHVAFCNKRASAHAARFVGDREIWCFRASSWMDARIRKAG